jgi:SAM-dependent methyltransferase
MSLSLHRRADLSEQQVAALEKALAAFYRNTPPEYYQMADRSSTQYNPRDQPFYCDLIGRVFPGATVLEAGCGTAHLCPYVGEKSAHYSGLDHSRDLLENNRRRFPRADFYSLKSPPAKTFDIVVSLYTIEHIADPPKYLDLLWQYCRPGGLIAIICPEFIASSGFAPSIFFGRTPRRLRDKLKAGQIADTVGHLLDLRFRAPLWKKRARTSPPGAFWTNLKPRILHGHDYQIDTDAVHLVQLRDLIWFFENKGAEILQTSANLPGISPEVLSYNCYLLARKPVGPPETVTP